MCVTAVLGAYAARVTSVALVGENQVLSSSAGAAVCITSVSTNAIVTCAKLAYPVNCAAVLRDGAPP
jgi:hypothetical protein